ncbi:tetratricopeptide repeat protein [Mesoflavibacter profundi]|uniref:Tetratricopeptide repeat protein n=1 Tax=Mesoflavibacter profundi TaxID=2708110 RepID=A0ABT4S283_9FLAO|nr:tetratricopeptide repeat protein [Mesoflavibacter profundi]MDA0177865.1 tetratricopeptide repeat protein [Mesoflavibacter profundi]
MKKKLYILYLFFGMLCIPQINYAQIDFNKAPDDDLGNFEDEFQEYFYEAMKQYGIENYDRAVQNLQKCLELDNSQIVIHYQLGKNYNQLKNFGAAEEALKEALKIQPGNEWVLDEMYHVYIQQKEYNKAIKTVRQLVKYHQDYKEDLANIYVQTGNFKDALKILDELDEEYGITDDRDLLRNRIYNATGRKKEQIENLEERVDKNPESEENYLKLIYRYSENNDKKKAFETAKKLLEIHPKSELVHLALYKYYLDEGSYDNAIQSMKIALQSSKINPDSKIKVLADFVKFVSANQQYEKDLVEITSMLTKIESSGKTLVELAQYYLVKGDKQKAISFYEKALQIEEENYGILRNIILLHIDLKQFEQAKERSQEGLEIFPSQPVLYLTHGVSLNYLNKPEQAIQTLEMGLDYIIEDVAMEKDFYNQLAKAYTAINNLTKAKAFKEKALQLQDTN